MDFATHVYRGDLARSRQEHGLSPAEIAGEASDISSRILAFYHAGEPFYSKETICDISQQLANPENQKVSIKALDGVVVDFDIETGKSYNGHWSDGQDFMIGAPFIEYHSIQSLMSQSYGFIPPIAFCSLSIFHYLQRWDKSTKKLIPEPPSRSRDEVKHLFGLNKQDWEASEQRRQLQSVMLTTTLPHVKKIVAFACGGMAEYAELPWKTWSAYQHALIITLRDILNERQGSANSIQCYAQDPCYTEVDKETLKQSGITVLDDPEGFLEVDDSTVVLSFSPNIPVRQIIADIAQPAMMVWDKIKFYEDELTKSIEITDPDSPRLSKMIQGCYEEVEFPGHVDAFGHVGIYIRRGALL